MQKQSKATMFLAERRVSAEIDGFRTLDTFVEQHSPHAGQAGIMVKDQTLAAGRSVNLKVENRSVVLVLPVVGIVEFRNKGEVLLVAPGEMQRLVLDTEEIAELYNPYEVDLINYILIQIPYPGEQKFADAIAFNLSEKNRFIQLGRLDDEGLGLNVSIAKFEGRAELNYTLSPENLLFAFVIQGAFEVHHRLIESRDSLVLWEGTEIEIEAISNDAIIIVIEKNMN